MHFTQNLDHHHMAFPPTHHGGGFMFHSQVEDQNDHLPSPSSLPSCPPHLFPVSGGGGGANFLMKRSMSFSGVEKCGGGEEDELSDDGSQLGEKKKRLNLEQVKALEKSFEIGNKLEPERKMQLAKALGLQPRQIAIWFQNRRARWKTKQLEKDYEVLKKQFDSLKADNDALHAHNKKLHAELMNLKGIDSNEDIHNNMKKESDQRSWSNGSENSCDHNNNNNNNNNIDTSPTLTTKHLFNTNSSSSMRSPTTTSMTQLLQSGVGSSNHHHPQLVHHQEENFCSMFEEQQNYWAWPEQHHPFSLNQSNFSNN